MKSHRTDGGAAYPVYSAGVQKLSDLLELPYPSKRFVLLIAADFERTPSGEIAEVAKQLIDKGLAYVCTWGPSCERAHDAFDLANLIWEEERGREFHVMSTWHSDEPIEEALWFALNVALVDEEIRDHTATVCVSISNPEWLEIIEQALDNVKAFYEKVLHA